MLTLGLFEGIVFAAVGALALIGVIAGGGPLHRIFGPAALAVIAVVTVGVVQEGGAPRFIDVLGLLFIALVLFGIPIAIMRYAWAEAHGKRTMEPHPVEESESPSHAAHRPVTVIEPKPAEQPRKAA